jgi:hypothetical protein
MKQSALMNILHVGFTRLKKQTSGWLNDISAAPRLMRQSRPFVLSSLAVAVLLVSLVAGCKPAKAKAQATGAPEVNVIEVATKYRDEWLASSSPRDAARLARSTILGKTRTPIGWHVIFSTPAGSNPATPEATLHVYLKASGELERIVPGK